MDEDDRRVKPHISSFSSFVNHFQNRVFEGQITGRQVVQPHFAFLNRVNTPYGLRHTSPADAICAHFVKKGLIRDRLGSSSLVKMTAACWSGNGKWLFCGLETGSYGLWEDEVFKVYKPIGVHVSRGANGEFEGTPIRAMAWSKHGDFIASGDEHGVIKIMNSSVRTANLLSGAHTSAVRAISFSFSDSKYVTCSDDNTVRIWSLDSAQPEVTYSGEQAHRDQVKCAEWHPYRSLIASGGKDSLVKLWDPRQHEKPVTTIYVHKTQINCLCWSANGHTLASAAKDGALRLFDIRNMRDCVSLYGHDFEITAMDWHPHHERVILTGAFNGSLIYWITGESQKPHTIISEAHRNSLAFIKWHPVGHCVATASISGIVKFWSREPPGSKLDLYDVTNTGPNTYDDPVVVHHGPPGPTVANWAVSSLQPPRTGQHFAAVDVAVIPVNGARGGGGVGRGGGGRVGDNRGYGRGNTRDVYGPGGVPSGTGRPAGKRGRDM